MSLPLATLSSADINSSFVRWDPIGLGEGAPNAHVRNIRERELQHGQAATIAVFFVSAAAVRSADLTVVAGRGDKRTKKGKIYAHSNGKSRPRNSGMGQRARAHKKGEAGDPYATLREWGKRQDPPMSVEEVVAARVSEITKVEVTNAEILEAITPF
jgi:ribosomal small subunit protein bTHX